MIKLEFGLKNAFLHKRHLRCTHNKYKYTADIKSVKTQAAHDFGGVGGFGFENTFLHKWHLRCTHNKYKYTSDIKSVKTQAAHDFGGLAHVISSEN